MAEGSLVWGGARARGSRAEYDEAAKGEVGPDVTVKGGASEGRPRWADDARRPDREVAGGSGSSSWTY